MLYLGWGWRVGWELSLWGSVVVIREANSVQWWVCGDCRQGVSCVLPALTCWVELCTDRTCISPLGTVGSAAHAHYTNLNVCAGHVFTIIMKY